MYAKKLITKYKIFNILNMVALVLMLLSLVFLEKDVFSMLFPKLAFKGLSILIIIPLVVVAMAIYFTLVMCVQNSISKILKTKCDPQTYKEVYFAISSKNNIVGKKLVEIVSEYYVGNFDIAKTYCYDVLQNDDEQVLRVNSLSILSQIYFLEEDVENLNYLRNLANNCVNIPKFGMTYRHIADASTIYIEFLVGDVDMAISAYSKAREICKSKCDLYLALYFYSKALIKSNRIEEAIPILQEIIDNANKLFVVHDATNILIYYATKN